MKNKNRAIPTGIATLLAMTAMAPVLSPQALAASQQISQPKLSASQAEAIARTTFQIPTSYQVQNESYQQGGQGNPNGNVSTYTFSFSPANQAPGSNYNVTLDANTGQVVDFIQFTQNQSFQFPVPTSLQQAQAIAIQWANKLYPSQYPQTKILAQPSQQNSLRYPISYQFSFERMVNGIPAPFDGFTITVDQNGHVTQVHDHWSNVSFPSSSADISQLQANNVYHSALNLHLSYTQLWQTNQQPINVLRYNQNQLNVGYWNLQFDNQYNVTGPVLNAWTGLWTNSDGTNTTPTTYQPPQPLVSGGPTQDPMQWTANWTEQQALAYATKVIDIPSDAVLSGANQWQAQKNDQTWHFTWQTPDGTTLNVSLDATHGFLQSYNEWKNQPMPQPLTQPTRVQPSKPLDSQQLLDIATAFVKKVLPNDTGAVAVKGLPTSPKAPNQPANFQITVLVNGIPNQSESGNLMVDPTTGQITEFWFNNGSQSSGSLPSPKNAISIDNAKSIWAQNHPLQLMYLETNPNFGKIQPLTAQQTAPMVELVYAPTAQTNLGILNALTGKFQTSAGQTLPYSGPIHDLTGVAAAPQIQLLVQRGLVAVDANENVHPNVPMTNGAFVKLLIDSLQLTQYYNQFSTIGSSAAAMAMANVPSAAPSYHEVQAAYAIGLIPLSQPFQPNSLTTRSEAAHMIARVLGLQPLLSHANDFNFNPTDKNLINKNNLAAAALTTMLGILPLQNGNFNPNGNLTLADAAVAIVQTANIGAQMNLTAGPHPLP